jgi:hypothetical protein
MRCKINMTIIVEDGSVVTGANSYATEAELTAYATARGITLTIGAELLLIKAMDWIEIQKYKGDQIDCEQVLEWPRYNVITRIGCNTASDAIPRQLKQQLLYVATGIDQGYDPTAYRERATSSETNCLGDQVAYLSGALDSYSPSTVANRFNELLRPRTMAYRL